MLLASYVETSSLVDGFKETLGLEETLGFELGLLLGFKLSEGL